MGNNCLIRFCVVLLVADDQRSYFMTNGHLPPGGGRLSFVCGSSVLRPRLATLAVSRYSGSSVSPTWRSASYGGLVCPSFEVHYARCISMFWEFRLPYLARLCTISRGLHSVLEGSTIITFVQHFRRSLKSSR